MQTLYSANDVIPAINLGKTGEYIAYHKGYLACDTSPNSTLSTYESVSLLTLAESVYSYYRKGLAAKRAKRISDLESIQASRFEKSFNERLKQQGRKRP